MSHSRVLPHERSVVLEQSSPVTPKFWTLSMSLAVRLDWPNRGQATLVPGTLPADKAGMNTVLAKGGAIHLKSFFDTTEEQNEAIAKLFFARTPETKITFESLLGFCDIVEHDADLVRKELSRRVNMEFDWKRKPDLLFDSMDYEHVAFCTVPWTGRAVPADLRILRPISGSDTGVHQVGL